MSESFIGMLNMKKGGHLQGSDSSHVVAEPGNRTGGEGPWVKLTPGEGFQDLGGVVNRDWGEGAGASRSLRCGEADRVTLRRLAGGVRPERVEVPILAHRLPSPCSAVGDSGLPPWSCRAEGCWGLGWGPGATSQLLTCLPHT
ncbi:MAG: hypothetical protein FRX49_05014 [Trebouxia sp. A1-2]|nr:MAG: hypothetical protein FRX49_05014 [Trebouxia sp. A1-2]